MGFSDKPACYIPAIYRFEWAGLGDFGLALRVGDFKRTRLGSNVRPPGGAGIYRIYLAGPVVGPAISRSLDEFALHAGHDGNIWWMDILVFIKTEHTELLWSDA